MVFHFKTYKELIDFAKKQVRSKETGQYDAHHILPKHAGGKNNQSNLILLTRFEHIYAHYLLALENKDHYFHNIAAANFLVYGKEKIIENDEQIKQLLERPNIQEFLEKLRLLNKQIRNSRSEYEYWVRNGYGVPTRVGLKTIENINNGHHRYNGFVIIGKECPICSKPNSRQSFACCADHEKKFLKQMNEKRLLNRRNCAKKESGWMQVDLRDPIYYSKEKISKFVKGIDVPNSLKGTKINNISACPICGSKNSNDSFACCAEHENQYIKMLLEKRSTERSEQLKKQHASGSRNTEEIRRKISESNIVTKSTRKETWITNGTTSIKIIQGEQIPAGFYPGRLVKSGWSQSEKTKQAVSKALSDRVHVQKDGNYKSIKPDELDMYLNNGWTKGHPDLRKYKRGRPKGMGLIWINNGKENRQCDPNNIPEDYIIGRIKPFYSVPAGRKKGFRWITNGTQSRTISNDLQIPEGWRQGRVII